LKTLEEGRRFADQQRASLAALGRMPEEIERAMEPLLAFQGQIRDEVTWYERARRGELDQVPLSQIGRLLIGLRIANGLTQRELAERLGVTEPVVSRDERNEYRGITIERAQRILDALNQAVSAKVDEPAERRELASVN
jgi:DNA-binding XRE family transcriptional regulator